MTTEQTVFESPGAVYQYGSSSGLVLVGWYGQSSGAMRVFDLYTREPVQNNRWTGLIKWNRYEN